MPLNSNVPGPILRPTSSAPTLPHLVAEKSRKLLTEPSQGIFGRQWTTENRRLMHELNERAWLKTQGKGNAIDYTDEERKQLRWYFDAVAEPLEVGSKSQRRIRVDRLEDMLISLGLAKDRRDVDKIMQTLDDTGSRELDFDQYLNLVRTRADPAIFQVFQAMIDGNLGDSRLNFRTVISHYRRGMIMDATGARYADYGTEMNGPEAEAAKIRGKKILGNFANLQKTRYDGGERRGSRGEDGEDLMPFDGNDKVPIGGMQQLWHTICHEHSLVPEQNANARLMGPPKSPRDIIRSIVPNGIKKRTQNGNTLVIGAPESLGHSSSSSLRASSRPTTQEEKGRKEHRKKLG